MSAKRCKEITKAVGARCARSVYVGPDSESERIHTYEFCLIHLRTKSRGQSGRCTSVGPDDIFYCEEMSGHEGPHHESGLEWWS
jgi:hypothetical protein